MCSMHMYNSRCRISGRRQGLRPSHQVTLNKMKCRHIESNRRPNRMTEAAISIGIQSLSQWRRVKGAFTVKICPTWQSANGGIATIQHNSIITRATRKGPGLWCPHQPIIKHQFHNVLPQAASPESFRQSSNHSITKKDAHLPKRHPSPIASRNNHQPSPLHPPESLEMAPLAHASRTCLRQLARSSPSATAARALSTSAARNDATATSYSSPFKGAQKGSQIPDFSKYMSKGSAQGNHLISYFMVGTMGAITAAGAKSTVQGTTAFFPHESPDKRIDDRDEEMIEGNVFWASIG